MPRLEGKRSNSGMYIIGLIVLLLVLLLVLELVGVTDLIANFGPSA